MYRRQSYGIGGALLKVGSNLAQGKGFGSGALQGVGKAAITPGSGIGAGAELAGNLLQKADNPLAQKIGQGLGVASNFAPGGGGIAGAVGDVAGLAAGAGGGGAAGGAAGVLGNLAQNVLGQARGGSIPYNPDLAGAPYRMRGVSLMKSGRAVYAENGVAVPGEPPSEFQVGQMVREGRGPSEEALTREMFAKQRLGFDGIPVAPTTKEGEAYESDPRVRKQVIEMRGRGHTLQGPSQQLEMKRMEYDDRMRELNDAYSDYFGRRSVVEPKGPEYSFQEGPGGEGGTLSIQNAQRQFNGGLISAQGGVNTSGAEEPPEDDRSYAQMFADEIGQIGSGLNKVIDRSGTEFSPATESIGSLFRRGYASQESADRAREASGQSGRVDALGDALGTFVDDKAANLRVQSGRSVNPFEAAGNAYTRSRMTDEARNSGRQFAGGRVRIRKRRR